MMGGGQKESIRIRHRKPFTSLVGMVAPIRKGDQRMEGGPAVSFQLANDFRVVSRMKYRCQWIDE